MTEAHSMKRPGGWRIHGWRSKGRGRRVTAASLAGQEHDTWIIRYNPWARDAARMKLRALDATAPSEWVATLKAEAATFVPYRRERKFRVPDRDATKRREADK